MLGFLISLIALCAGREGAFVQFRPELGLVGLVEYVAVLDEAPDIDANLSRIEGVKMPLRDDAKFGMDADWLSGADAKHARLFIALYGSKVRFSGVLVPESDIRGNRDIMCRGLAPIVAGDCGTKIFSGHQPGMIDRRNVDIGAQFAAGRPPRLCKSKGHKKGAEETQNRGKPGGVGRASRSVSGLPLGAQITASLILSILAAYILLTAYVIDSLDNPRRAAAKLSRGLILFSLSVALWMLSATQ